MKKLLFLVAVFAFSLQLSAKYYVTKINNKNAVIYTPDNFDATQATDVAVFYPGLGEADGVLDHLYNQGLPLQIKAGKQFPFVIVCIQPSYAYFQNADATKADLDAVAKLYNVNKLYLTGLSAGGWAVNNYLTKSVDYAKRIAGAVVMSAQPDATVGPKFQYGRSASIIKATGVKYWMITGGNDGFYTADKKLCDTAGGIFTTVANAGHSAKVWTPGYDPDTTFAEASNRSMYGWLANSLADVPEVSKPPVVASQKTIALRVQTNGQVYLKNIAGTYNAAPGDVLVIPTNIPLQSVYLDGIHGTADEHITVKFATDSFSFGGYKGYNMVLSDVQFVDFPQTININGHDTSGNGIIIGTKCSDITFADVNIAHTAAGLQIKWEPIEGQDSTYYPLAKISNILFKDVSVKNTRGEALYIGHSGTMSAAEQAAGKLPPLLYNISFNSITVDSSNWDGAQFSNIIGLSISHLLIKNYGRSDVGTQRDGLLLGGNVILTKPIEDVIIKNGTGAGIRIFSRGLVSIKSVILNNVGLSTGEHAVYVDDRPSAYGLPPLQLSFDYFSIDSTVGNAMFIPNYRKTQLPGRISNVTYQRAKPVVDNAGDTVLNVGQAITIQPVPTPTPATDPTSKPGEFPKLIKSFLYKKKTINVYVDADGKLTASFAQ